MIDCNHANSAKEPGRQPTILEEVVRQSLSDKSVIGAMIESNLQPGNQSFPQPKEDLRYGVSITDGCIGWDETEAAIRQAHAALEPLF